MTDLVPLEVAGGGKPDPREPLVTLARARRIRRKKAGGFSASLASLARRFLSISRYFITHTQNSVVVSSVPQGK
jgi:hypothetical protein